MKRLPLQTLLILAAIAIVILVGVFFTPHPALAPHSNLNTSVVQSKDAIPTLDQTHAVSLDKQIENWSLYAPGKSVVVNYSESEGRDPAFDTFLKQVANGEQQVLTLNGGLDIVLTPNYPHWTKAQLAAAQLAPNAWGGVGVPSAYWISADRILWINSCLGGIGPDPSVPGYVATQKCYQAEQVFRRHFACRDDGGTSCKDTSAAYSYHQSDVPLNVMVPSLWNSEFLGPYEGNSLTHEGESFTSLTLSKMTQTSDDFPPTVLLAWYSYDAKAKLSDIQPILYGDTTKDEAVTFLKHPARHIISTMNVEDTGLAEQELYLLWLKPGTILQIIVSYPTPDAPAVSATEVSTILDTLVIDSH